MQVVFHGRRWFSNETGNSEHSISVYVDGVEIGYKKGYGGLRMYEQNGRKILFEKGFNNKMINPLCLVSDVKRRADL